MLSLSGSLLFRDLQVFSFLQIVSWGQKKPQKSFLKSVPMLILYVALLSLSSYSAADQAAEVSNKSENAIPYLMLVFESCCKLLYPRWQPCFHRALNADARCQSIIEFLLLYYFLLTLLTKLSSGWNQLNMLNSAKLRPKTWVLLETAHSVTKSWALLVHVNKNLYPFLVQKLVSW